MRPSLPVLSAAAALIAALALSACGIKDDLYLPEAESSSEQTETVETEDDAENS